MCRSRELFLLIFIVGMMIATGIPGYNWAIRHDFGTIVSVFIGIGGAASIVLGFILSCYIIATPVYLIRRRKDQLKLTDYSRFVFIVLFVILSIFGFIMMVTDFVLWIM